MFVLKSIIWKFLNAGMVLRSESTNLKLQGKYFDFWREQIFRGGGIRSNIE